MSTIARHRASGTEADTRPGPDSTRQTHTVAWLVSRSAARSALARTRPDIVIAPSSSCDHVRLTWQIRIETSSSGAAVAWAAATLDDTACSTSVALTGESRGMVVRDRAGSDELVHIEVPGALVCTLRAGRTLYASTPLLAALGLAGGRYDVVV